MRTYKLHLIRHGLTQANQSGIYCGSTDIPLCEEGISELCHKLANSVYPYAEWVFSSPLTRAAETARILYPDYEINEIENLRETCFGEFEGKSMEQLRDNQRFARWIAGDPECLPDGAEPPLDFFNRCIGAALSIINMMMTSSVFSAAVVTHAGVIGNILAGLAYPRANAYEWNPPPGGGYTLAADPSIFLREPVLEVIDTLPLPVRDDTDDLFNY